MDSNHTIDGIEQLALDLFTCKWQIIPLVTTCSLLSVSLCIITINCIQTFPKIIAQQNTIGTNRDSHCCVIFLPASTRTQLKTVNLSGEYFMTCKQFNCKFHFFLLIDSHIQVQICIQILNIGKKDVERLERTENGKNDFSGHRPPRCA